MAKSEDYKRLASKIENLCEDMANNVTKIFMRPDLHLAFLIAYCSVLHYKMGGKVNYGIINCLLAGDSSQGKSQIGEEIVKFLNLGIIHDFATSKRAGLLGGLESLGAKGKWFIKWGIIPLQDRQLVILEELKAADEDLLQKLRSMRSKKEAEITGIVVRKTPARTRLVMISNPKSSTKDVESYDFGIKIIRELMGHLEDCRRLDFAMIVGKCEMDGDARDEMLKNTKDTPPVFSAECWRKLILWIWTRDVEQVVFEEGYRNECLERAKDLYSTFTETIPLVDSGSMRHKLTKIAIAIAAMTFNTDGENYEKLLVQKVHLEYAHDFLVRIYSTEACGYKTFSEDDKYSKVLRNSDKKFLRRRLLQSRFPRSLVEQLLHAEEIDKFDLMGWCDVLPEMAQKLLGEFIRKRALFRTGFKYERSPGFTRLLKALLIDPEFPINKNEDEEIDINNMASEPEF